MSDARGANHGHSAQFRPGVIGWVSLALVCASAVLCAVLELMFISQFYIGGQIIPVVIIAAVANNIGLPVLGHHAVRAPRGAILPVLFWLVTLLFLSIYQRPEGDVLVLSAYDQDLAFYGMLLFGGIAGFGSIVVLGGRAPIAPSRNPQSQRGGRVNR